MAAPSLVSCAKRKWGTVLLGSSIWTIVLFGSIQPAFADAPTAPQFQNGDRVCFVGDSITDMGNYHSYLQLFYATRFPDRKIKYFPAGHSGGTARDCLGRLGWDILDNHPNIATVNFGMNDMGGGTFGAPKATSEEVDKAIQEKMNLVQIGYEDLLDALKSAGVRLVLVGPSIYDDTVQIDNLPPTRSNRAMTLWTQRIKEIAKRRNLGFVDLGTPMNQVNARLQSINPKATIVGQDRVHPYESGHLVMAYAILKAQGIGPDVARISLDAATGEATRLINCDIEKIQRQNDGISFVCRENALPFPTPDRAEKALEMIPFTDELNREMLVVGKLPEGNYDLRIDDAVVGQYSAGDLANGVNLSLNSKTPQYKQSQRLLRYNSQRHTLENQLRYLPFLRQSVPALKNTDLKDSAAVEKVLRDAIARLRPGDYTRHIAETYLSQVFGRADAIQDKVDQLKGQMEDERMPHPHTFALAHAR